jgi:hypothetical protein
MKICFDVLESIQDIKDKIEDISKKLLLPIGNIENWLSGGLIGDDPDDPSLQGSLSYTVDLAIETMILEDVAEFKADNIPTQKTGIGFK